MPGNKVAARLSGLERRLDDIEARAKRSRVHRPEVTVEYIAEVLCCLRQSASMSGRSFAQELRNIGIEAPEAEKIALSYGPTAQSREDGS